MSDIWVSQVARSADFLTAPVTYDWAWMSYGTNTNESCHTCKSSCHTYGGVMCHETHITHKSIWINKSSVNPKSTSIQSSKPCTVLQYPSRKADFIQLDFTHTHVWHDSCICMTWLIHTCKMTHSYVRLDSTRLHSYTCVTWIMTRSYVWQEGFDARKERWMSLIHVCDMIQLDFTHTHVWHD